MKPANDNVDFDLQSLLASAEAIGLDINSLPPPNSRFYRHSSARAGAPTFLYAIKCRDRIKIGYAANVESRCRDLQAGCPYTLTILCRHELKSNRFALLAEKAAHIHAIFE